MSIAAHEEHFINDLKAAFDGRLKAVESLPAQWDDRTFERLLRSTPGLFVVFGGGPRLPDFQDHLVIDGNWAFIAVTTHASGELARRRGDSREIGAYEIIELVASRYEGATIPGAPGPMHLDDIQNLFDDKLEKQGAAVYAVSFLMPTLIEAADAAAPALDDFLTFNDTFDLAPADGQGDAQDHVELPQ